MPNKQEVYNYRTNKFKDNAFIVYITLMTVAIFMIAFIKLS